MSNHTPGPWHQDKWGHIKKVNGNSVLFGGVTISGFNTEEVKANDKLACAAPEMLDVLKIAQGYIEAVVFNSTNSRKRNNYAKCLHLINDVIAKAEGSDERSTG